MPVFRSGGGLTRFSDVLNAFPSDRDAESASLSGNLRPVPAAGCPSGRFFSSPWRGGVAGALFAPAVGILLLVLLAAGTARADVLVSNSSESRSSPSTAFHAQWFTTGSNTSGYTVTDVQLYMSGSTSGRNTVVTIREVDSSDNPDMTAAGLVATLTNPNSYTDSSFNTFTAPSDTTLESNTTYVISVNEGVGSSRLRYGLTPNDSQTGLTGWSINNGRLTRTTQTANWTFSGNSLVLTINGTANTATFVCTDPNTSGRTEVWTGDHHGRAGLNFRRVSLR